MNEFDFLGTLEKAIQKQDSEQQVAILKKALDEHGWKSPLMSDLALMVANYNLPFVSFLEAYCDHNVETPHGAEIKLADIYVGQNRMDQATARARQFVSKLRGTDAERNLQEHPVLLGMVARCYLLITAVYTQLGARQYSQRVLSAALKLSLPEGFDLRLRKEIVALENELKDKLHQEINLKWEAFFSGNGSKYFLELADLCIKNQAPHLARRLELLKSRFEFDRQFKMDENEILMDIFSYRESEESTELKFELR